MKMMKGRLQVRKTKHGKKYIWRRRAGYLPRLGWRDGRVGGPGCEGKGLIGWAGGRARGREVRVKGFGVGGGGDERVG